MGGHLPPDIPYSQAGSENAAVKEAFKNPPLAWKFGESTGNREVPPAKTFWTLTATRSPDIGPIPNELNFWLTNSTSCLVAHPWGWLSCFTYSYQIINIASTNYIHMREWRQRKGRQRVRICIYHISKLWASWVIYGCYVGELHSSISLVRYRFVIA